MLLLLVEKETVKKDDVDWRSRIELQLEDSLEEFWLGPSEIPF